MVPPTNRIATRISDPTPEQIQEECHRIQASWTNETENQRRVHYRLDHAQPLIEAQLRFISFLIARSNGVE